MTYYKICFALLLFLFQFALLQAQQKLSGSVNDSVSGKPVPNVYIMLMNDEGTTIHSYSYSLDNGAVIIEFPDTEQQHYRLSTSRLGYRPWQKGVSRHTEKLEIKLQETTIPLREVKVKSTPIMQRGDTIDYFISSFVRPQDRTLADVLARMPGIEVQFDGRVQYEGKPINRFYIENMNLLEQRYSLATKNLSPEDISTVQVYENHEPVKMLRDRSDSEQAALNIKLKEDAKAKWLHSFDFGVGGSPFLYDANGTLARFSRVNQSMMIGKANNTGKDVFLELKLHRLQPGEVFRPGLPEGISDQLNPLSGNSSFFTRDRARFNESAITSLNQLWRVAEEGDLRLNINYGFEKEQRERVMESAYLFVDQPSIILNDHTSQRVNWHKLENELAYTANRSSYFLEEKLHLNLHWKEALAEIETNQDAIRQKLDLPRIHIKNRLSISRLIGDVSIGAGSNTEFTRLPQTLSILSSDTLSLFSTQSAYQSVQFNNGFSDTFITLNYKKRNHSIDLKAGAELVWEAIESELDPLPEMHDHFHNSLTWETTRFYAEPSHRLNYRHWTITSSVSANYIQSDYSGKKENDIYFNPLFRLIYEPNGNIKFNAGYSYRLRYGDLNQMQTGYILKRYDQFSKGIEALQRTATQSLNWGVFYKNISHFINLHYLGFYSYYRNNLVPAILIRDYYNFTRWEYKENPATFWVNRLSATKLFTNISLTAGLSLTYNQYQTTMEQQGAAIQYTNHSFAMSPSLKWNAKKNLNFDYTMDAFFTGVSINKAPNTTVSNLLFADLGVQYVLKKVTLHLDWTNIFNQKQHVTASYNAINTLTRVDHLRPAEVLVTLRFKR